MLSKRPSIFWGPPIKEQKVPSLLQTSASTAAPKLPTAPKILFIIISIILSETTTQHFHFICSRDHDRVLLDKNIKLIYETILQSIVNDQKFCHLPVFRMEYHYPFGSTHRMESSIVLNQLPNMYIFIWCAVWGH